MLSRVFLRKLTGYASRRLQAALGRIHPLGPTLAAMAARPYELHLELTNLCNASCVFCPYQFQKRETQFMSDQVFEKAVGDFVAAGGGSIGLTPIVGDALIDPKFLQRVRALRSHAEIDRIWLTTNAILLDKHGIDDILDSGLTSVTISTSGFDEATYKRVYRSSAYQRMRRNVQALVERNAERSDPLPITIGLRVDRPLDAVLADPDFQPILKHKPEIDFTWSFTSANGRITREQLPAGMRLRVVSDRSESCVQLYNGPIVLPDGAVLGCSCVAAMDAGPDLGIGNVLQTNLIEVWTGAAMQALRASFGTPALNPTCAGCDMYRDLELYRISEGRTRAAINRDRGAGRIVRRDQPTGAFSGG